MGKMYKASAYGSRVGWTPARWIHTYIHGEDAEIPKTYFVTYSLMHREAEETPLEA